MQADSLPIGLSEKPLLGKTVIYLFFFFFLFLATIFFSFYFNWRLITLNIVVVFAIHSHESAMDVHVFPILNPPTTSLPIPPLWVIPGTNPEHSASCIEPGVAIYFIYVNIHVSMLFSQIIPPLPSPTESNSLFFTSVSLLLSRI